MTRFVFISSVRDFDLPDEIKQQAIDDTQFIVWARVNGKPQFIGRATKRSDAVTIYKKEKAK